MSPEFKRRAEDLIDEVVALATLQKEEGHTDLDIQKTAALTRERAVRFLAEAVAAAVEDTLKEKQGRAFSGARSLTGPGTRR